MKKQKITAAERKAAAARSAARTAERKKAALERRPPRPARRPTQLDQVFGVLKALRESISAIQAGQASLARELPLTLAGRQAFIAWSALIPANSSHTFELPPDCETFTPQRLVFTPSKPGLEVVAIDFGGEEQLMGPMPSELFSVGQTSLDDQLTLFDVAGPGDTIVVRNPTVIAIQVGIQIRGQIETDRSRALRWQRIAEKLRHKIALSALPPRATAEIPELARFLYTYNHEKVFEAMQETALGVGDRPLEGPAVLVPWDEVHNKLRRVWLQTAEATLRVVARSGVAAIRSNARELDSL